MLKNESYLPAKLAAVVFILQFEKEKPFLIVKMAVLAFILQAEKGILLARKNSSCHLHSAI